MKTPAQIERLLAIAKLMNIEATTKEAPGAWPNGSRVVKTRLDEGDAHPVGSLATVVGSLGPIPFGGREKTYGYFVFWDDPPGDMVPVFLHDGRIALAPASDEPPRSQQEQDDCFPDEVEAVRDGKCADCGAPLEEGPHGGLSVNWYCTGASCGSKFNVMGPLGVQRISDASPKRRAV